MLAQSYGVLIAGGVRVSVSYRDLALLAGTSLPTIRKALTRLARSGWLSKDNARRKRNEAGAFVLKLPQLLHTQPQGKREWLSVKPLRGDLPPLGHGAGRLSKKAEQVLEALLWGAVRPA